MKRLNNNEKKQIGHLIHYYRSLLFRSEATNSADYKQINFCNGVCSQTQLSRLEHGEPLKNQEIYAKLLSKLNLQLNKVSNQDVMIFETYFENILTYQNDDDLIINYNEYVLIINKYQNIFKDNIIYTHYNYSLEFILCILNHDILDASYLLEDVENNLDILPPNFLILTLQYLGIYYYIKNNYNKANKFYLLAIEHMHKYQINNPIIYIDIANNYLKMKQSLHALDYLNKAISQFMDTHNKEILTKIHLCYGLIYFKNKFYEDGLNYLSKALDYSKKVVKRDLIIKIYRMMSVGFYFKEFHKEAIEMIENALIIKKTDDNQFIHSVLLYKMNQEEIKIQFNDENYQRLIYLFQTDNKEEWFDEKILPNLNEYTEAINLLILYEMYNFYKQNKKYKKALTLLEEYII